ncbi:UDP-glycosyltransferase [Quillaja saponaria]|uniref:UDP-glycosyltransferase n=1 Tax=Quillaja saponaria TaxID=32244 RepID=A0AAD7PXL8_QUISA|nr:UDP-glycosyltransferase [Quillaja saponaria]
MICNSTDDLEPAASASGYRDSIYRSPYESHHLGNSAGCFRPEDSTCSKWLDEHPANSVIYVAFGSLTVSDQTQLEELDLGLEFHSRGLLDRIWNKLCLPKRI